MSGKFYVQTHGCQMNAYDSARMADLMVAEGLSPTEDPVEADLILLNTCSIREKAQEKVFSQLGRWKRLKQQKPDLLIGVGGCVASQEGEALLQRAPFVDLVFGPQTLHRLPELIAERRKSARPQVDIRFPAIEKFDALPEPSVKGPTAFVSVMEGCSKYCSYCVVPYTRGPEVSRPFDDVVAEVAGLAERGVREVILLGQNVNAYRGALNDGGHCDLGLLIQVLAEIDGIARIRFTTSHPAEFDDALIRAYAECDKLVDWLHLPVQAGSDRVLAAMKRGYTVLEYKQKIRKLRAVRPKLSLSSDFIVGFPGETETDFAKTMQLIDDLCFDQSYSFVFSARPGTPAAALPDPVPLATKKQRLATLQARIEELARGYSEAMLGSVQQVLVDGPSSRDPAELCGRTSNNRVVNFAAPARLIGQLVDVRITEVRHHSLRGEVVTADTPRRRPDEAIA